MNLPKISHEDSGLSSDELRRYEARLAPELQALQAAAKTLYVDDHASINLPLDTHNVRAVKALASVHKKATLIVVIGIGGSNLGTVAVQEALLGRLHNLNPGKRPRIVYADTVDPDSIAHMVELVHQELKQKHHVVFNAVSKSGGTTETIANLEVFLAVLAQHKRDPRKHVVVTTDEGSLLWHHATDAGYATLAIPKKVGGRYSVFSPVGLFALALLGIDIAALLKGAAEMRARCLAEHDNPAMLRAALLAKAHADGKNIADNFYFKTDLESIGKWYRQLMGESIGKEWNARHTERLWTGITPTVSIGSTDLHSMAQLYFGGPHDKFFTLVTVEKSANATRVPRMNEFDGLVPNIQGRPFAVIMDGIVHGVAGVLREQKRPFCTIALENASEYSIGALLQLHMMEMMYLASLLEVNPFDQPNVEAYKIHTKRYLAGK